MVDYLDAKMKHIDVRVDDVNVILNIDVMFVYIDMKLTDLDVMFDDFYVELNGFNVIADSLDV